MKRQSVDNVNQKSTNAAGEVFEAIHAIMHLFRSQQYRGLREGSLELTHMEGKLLGFFARNPGATLSDLVDHSGRDKGQLAKLIKSLKDAGLLSARKDEKDRRNVGLELTPEGKAIHKTLHRQSERLVKLAVGDLKEKERGQLLDLLQRVRANLETNG